VKSEGGITHSVKSSSTPNWQGEEPFPSPCDETLTKDDEDDDGKVGGATTSKVTLHSGPNGRRKNNDTGLEKEERKDEGEGRKVDSIEGDDDGACDEKQLLRMQIQEQRRENCKLRDDLDRLRRHLISVEDEYTTELLTAEDREKGLRNRLAEYEIVIQRLQSQIGPQNRPQDGLKSQFESITAERDCALMQLSSLDDRVQQLVASNERLQLLLEQTTKEYEEKLQEVEKRWESEVSRETARADHLEKRLKWQEERFAESVAALGAAGRLADQIDAKEQLIFNLKEEISRKEKETQLARKEIEQLKSSHEGKVDKQIIKNLVLGYFSSPPDKKHEVERLLARILDFNQEEMDRAKLRFRSPSQQQDSLATIFVQFLENESSPKSSPSQLPSTSPALSKSSNPVRQLAQNLFMSTVSRDQPSQTPQTLTHSRTPSTASSTGASGSASSAGGGGKTPSSASGSGANSTGNTTPVTPVVVTSMTANNLLIHPVNKINSKFNNGKDN